LAGGGAGDARHPDDGVLARPLERARLVRDELVQLDRMLQAALRQGSDEWPKGVAWN